VKDDRVYLQHIRDAIEDIVSYTRSGRDAFLADRMRQDATLRKLEVIGQGSRISRTSASRASRRFRRSRSQGCATRSFTITSASIEIVWGVVDKELPKLAAAIDRLLVP